MRHAIFILLGIVFLTGCGSHKDNTPAPAPGKTVLLAPAQDQVCTQGTVVSSTQSTVTLKWTAAANAVNYEVNVKNLEDGTIITQTTSSIQLDVTLKRNTPYSWSVTAKATNSATTTQSDTWKFYNSGPAIVNYAPFPAQIVAPAMGQTIEALNGKITLSWNGSDVDNDIVTYDVYLSDSASPALLQSNVSENTLKDVSVSAGKTYYWKIITRDSKGNTSDSGIYLFMTK
ncbi:hypothetical protein PQ469_30450 [Mucilaginibacter sp. KACC 22773]|jgi:fibronectin type 3 domain-containing protein|uniref:hypothetical protein n=1 Tax=Mucilaginibacter sp. KACC 22773 TaxID=3025671 RepID=UPI00236675EC|nr:hypothetical protein [Mucilaginibacter sp. KACC 22773]WDF78209.1 hypothetical protein PQ469_30450 [Mucilaginibacter sp. KACC 22773]